MGHVGMRSVALLPGLALDMRDVVKSVVERSGQPVVHLRGRLIVEPAADQDRTVSVTLE